MTVSPIVVDLQKVDMLKTIDQLLYKRGQVDIIFDNGEHLMMHVRKLIFHLIFWNVGRKWGIEITPHHVVDTEFIFDKTITDISTAIFHSVQAIHTSYYSFVYDMNDAVNYLNRFTINHCQEYHETISIVDLANVSMIPEIKRIVDDKVTAVGMSIKKSNDKLKKNFGLLFEELKKPHEGNVLSKFVNLRFVKATAVAHIFYQIGFRTDIDDNAIRYPIQGNYLDGLNNTVEYCLESLSAKKATFYNMDSLPTAEYFARRQHILLSSVRHLYKGDCGSHITLPYFITDKFYETALYKNIVEDGKIISLSRANIKQYIGKVVNMRTSIGCRYVDGVCETCAGRLIANLSPNTHIGMFSAIQVASVITQVILSAKHVQETAIVEYIIPDELSSLFVKIAGTICVNPRHVEKFKNITLVFRLEDSMHLRDIGSFNINRLNTINEASFGRCHELLIIKGNNPITEQVSLNSCGQFPLFSKQLIKHIAENQDCVTIKEAVFMVSMRNFDFKQPIFKITVMNNSMVKFVSAAKKLIESSIRRYTSVPELISDFSNLVFSQVTTNIAYLEIVLRGTLITDNHDFRIPVVDDVDNVKFAINTVINMKRSLGTLCAFEQLPSSLKDPRLYFIPRTMTNFDEFLNLKQREKPYIIG